jgi:hypothetical protein
MTQARSCPSPGCRSLTTTPWSQSTPAISSGSLVADTRSKADLAAPVARTAVSLSTAAEASLASSLLAAIRSASASRIAARTAAASPDASLRSRAESSGSRRTAADRAPATPPARPPWPAANRDSNAPTSTRDRSVPQTSSSSQDDSRAAGPDQSQVAGARSRRPQALWRAAESFEFYRSQDRQSAPQVQTTCPVSSYFAGARPLGRLSIGGP